MFNRLFQDALGDAKTISSIQITDEKSSSVKNETAEIIKGLTPKSSKLEIENLKLKLSALSTQVEDLKNQVDPRMFNNPLPNDAVMTYEYGARAFYSNCYPGYIWRNGSWYLITPTFKFEPLPKITCEILIENPTWGGNIDSDKTNFVLDDSWYPVKMNGTRIFIREKFVSHYDAHHKLYNFSKSYAYLPFTQNVIEQQLIPSCYDSRKNINIHKLFKDGNGVAVVNGLKIEYEDYANTPALL
jgi:hypothetical protein